MAKANLRQRVLGAAVILSIGFICYSILIQSGSSSYIDRSAQIPVQTRYIEPLDFDEPIGRQEMVTQAKAPEEMFLSERAVDLETIQSAPVLDESGKPNSWVVQVGSFSTSDRATEIREQLVAQGYRAYFRKIISEEGADELYRVMVGPYVDAGEVERHMSELDVLLGLQTVLKDYEP